MIFFPLAKTKIINIFTEILHSLFHFIRNHRCKNFQLKSLYKNLKRLIIVFLYHIILYFSIYTMSYASLVYLIIRKLFSRLITIAHYLYKNKNRLFYTWPESKLILHYLHKLYHWTKKLLPCQKFQLLTKKIPTGWVHRLKYFKHCNNITKKKKKLHKHQYFTILSQYAGPKARYYVNNEALPLIIR